MLTFTIKCVFRTNAVVSPLSVQTLLDIQDFNLIYKGGEGKRFHLFDFLIKSEFGTLTELLDLLENACIFLRKIFENIEICHVSPDVVSLSGAASVLEISRQTLQQVASDNPDFPAPVHIDSNASTAYFNLASILVWYRSRNYQIDFNLLITSVVALVFNSRISGRRVLQFMSDNTAGLIKNKPGTKTFSSDSGKNKMASSNSQAPKVCKSASQANGLVSISTLHGMSNVNILDEKDLFKLNLHHFSNKLHFSSNATNYALFREYCAQRYIDPNGENLQTIRRAIRFLELVNAGEELLSAIQIARTDYPCLRGPFP